MFRRTEDFERIWWVECAVTSRMLRNVTEASLAQRESPDGRTLGETIWRLATALGDIMRPTDVIIQAAVSADPMPATLEELLDAYRVATRSFIEQIRGQWDNPYLLKEIEISGEPRPRGFFLYAVLREQLQLRGQLATLMRQAGLEVPSLNIPTREEMEEMYRQRKRHRLVDDKRGRNTRFRGVRPPDESGG